MKTKTIDVYVLLESGFITERLNQSQEDMSNWSKATLTYEVEEPKIEITKSEVEAFVGWMLPTKTQKVIFEAKLKELFKGEDV